MKLRNLLIIMCFVVSLIPIAMISGFEGFQIASLFLSVILIITLVVGIVIAYFISVPLEKLTKNIDEISKGNLDVELEQSEIYEINNLTISLDRVMASLKLAIHKVGLKKEEIFEEVVRAKEVAEEKYENLLKKIDGWIWEIDEKGICTVCSPKITETLGYTPTQLIKKDIFGFLSSDNAQKLKEMVHYLSHQTTDEARKIDLYWTSYGDRHPVWVRSYLLPVFDDQGHFHGLRCFSRDITENRNLEHQIETLQKKLGEFDKQLYELMQERMTERTAKISTLETPTEQEFDYMLIFDENAKIIDCTNDIQKKLGYNKEEMLSLSFADVVYLESFEEIKESLSKVKKQGTMQLKNIHKKKDGSSVFVSEHIKYLKDRNMFICMVKEDKM